MFVFDCTKIIDYQEYMDFLTALRSQFDHARNGLFDTYSIVGDASAFDPIVYDAFRRQYRSLRQDVIKAVLARFRGFFPTQSLIYEFGSLTKFTDRIESDIDLTICYDGQKTPVRESAEELVDYTIATVFDQSIDHVHGKFQHYPIDRLYDSLTEEDNLYALQFSDQRIEYKCGPETLSENLTHIKNKRDYNSLLDGYKEKYAFKCNIDCLYSIAVLENTSGHDFIGDIAALEKDNDIFDGYRYGERVCAFANPVEISHIKRSLKDSVVDMYIMISYLRKRANWLCQYSMTMDDVFASDVLRRLFGDDYLDRMRYSLLRVIFYWDKIELMLKRRGILLSTRCHRHFQLNELNGMLYREYGGRGMMEELAAAINSLNGLVSEGWRQMSCMKFD